MGFPHLKMSLKVEGEVEMAQFWRWYLAFNVPAPPESTIIKSSAMHWYLACQIPACETMILNHLSLDRLFYVTPEIRRMLYQGTCRASGPRMLAPSLTFR
jgi:hypothetical protein